MATNDTRTIAQRSAYYAHLLLDPIKVPGTAYVTDLAERTRALPLEDQALADWCERVERLAAEGAAGTEALAEEQRAIAADRTQLCRGIAAEGPLPPYEAYYREGAAEIDVGAAYRAAGVHFDGAVERNDYLGAELAFVAHLAEAELAAEAQGDARAAAQIAQQRAVFEQEHVRSWLGAFCAAARPRARTAFFKGALAELERFAG